MSNLSVMEKFKNLNPCCCVSPAIASFIIALVDIGIGCLTLYGCGVSFYYFQRAESFLDANEMKHDVLWWGICSISLVGLFGTWSGFNLFLNVACRKNSGESPHVWKFLLFFLTEVIGFIAPFYIFADYIKKIQRLHENLPWFEGKFSIYRLLEVNPVTIALFVYQIFSFWVVHRYHLLNAKINRNRQRVLIQRANPQPVVVEMRQMITPEDPYEAPRYTEAPSNSNIKNVKSSSRAGLPKRPNSEVFINYPDLKSMRDEMETLPSFGKLQHGTRLRSVVVNISDEEVESPVTNNINTLVRRKVTEFEKLKERYRHPEDYFEDDDFPANYRSLGTGLTVKWLRPYEINKNARFITDGFSRFDVKQGTLGDCWFLAAAANLTLNEKYFKHVAPQDNEWADAGIYAGMCRFRFHDGIKWVEVTIDDRLPTIDGKLIYMHSSNPTEFWSALLEKAYAKFNGSYAALIGNDGIGRAMENLTGGKTSRHHLQRDPLAPKELYNRMSDALENRHMVGICAQQCYLEHGIVGRHAYSVTHISRIIFQSGRKLSCVRIRNPWGDDEEWNGEMSDNHPIWDLVDKKTKKDMEVKYQDDGEFWIPLAQVYSYFTFVEICYINKIPPKMTSNSSKH